jgi:hypothetical protein
MSAESLRAALDELQAAHAERSSAQTCVSGATAALKYAARAYDNAYVRHVAACARYDQAIERVALEEKEANQ